jgi:hypothetical protein
MIKQKIVAAAVGALLLASAGSSLAQTSSSSPPIDPRTRPLAEADLARAKADMNRPPRAAMDVQNAETVLANGAEARGASVTPADQPFAEMVTARQALRDRKSARQVTTAINQAEAATHN